MSKELSKQDAEDLFNSSGTEIKSKDDAVNVFESSGTPVEAEADPSMLQKAGNLASTANRKMLDLAQGVSSGASMGLLDEAGGALSALGESAYNKLNPTNRELEAKGFKVEQPGLGELYRKNQQMIQNELEAGKERSPVLSTIGQLGGGAATGSALLGALGGASVAPSLAEIAANSGKLKALGQLGIRGAKLAGTGAALGAVEGATTSKEGGILTPEERSKLGDDIVSGAEVGAIAGPVLGAAGETIGGASSKLKNYLSNFIEETPLLRQMGIAHEYGLQGINPKSQTQTLATDLNKTGITELDNTRTKALMNEIYAADTRIGQSVGKSLTDAEATGKVVNIDQNTKDALSQVMSLGSKYPELADNTRAQQIYGKLSQAGGEVTPTEAKDLISYMDAYIGKFKSATNKTPLEEGILSNLLTNRKGLSNELKTQIPEYGAASERFAQFRKLVPETIIARNRPVDIKDEYFGNLNNQDQKMFDSLKQMVQGTTRSGESTQPVRESFVQSMKGLKQFEASDAERLASGAISKPALQRPASAIESEIKKFSDDAVARSSMDALEPHTGLGGTAKQAITGINETGRSTALGGANLAGRIQANVSTGMSKNPVAQMSRSIFNAPDETVNSLANTLKGQAGLEKYGNQLQDALQSTNVNRRNQVLFTIMQNPSARSFVGKQADKPKE